LSALGPTRKSGGPQGEKMTELGNKNYKNVLIQNLQKAKMTLKSLSPDSDLLSNILEVVSDLRQTAHMLEDVVQELTKNVDTKTKRPEKKTKHGSKDVLKIIIILHAMCAQ
jgi:SpoVK/Ycf46/Vps4 family AAA+-type ATPase